MRHSEKTPSATVMSTMIVKPTMIRREMVQVFMTLLGEG